MQSSAKNSPRSDTVACPVCGREVTFKVTYSGTNEERRLVDFECAMEGLCGIPSWDPCPIYVNYMKNERGS